jgi:hypothetical protein
VIPILFSFIIVDEIHCHHRCYGHCPLRHHCFH